MDETTDWLDLMILNSGTPNSAIGFARRAGDVMISEIPSGKKLQDLLDFTNRIQSAIEAGPLGRPPNTELLKFGNDLFTFCFANGLEKLYSDLPSSHIRMQFLSCHSEMKKVPWEFMQEPELAPGPRLARSIVRIVPFFGKGDATPKAVGDKIKVLFVASYPIDQDRVSWADIAKRIDRLPASYDSIVLEKCIPGTWNAFSKAVNKFKPDVVHFSGHGRQGPKGTQLLFMEPDTNNTIEIETDDLTTALRDRGIQLVVLTACETSTQPRKLETQYAVLAETLVKNGINAVVANQLPVADDTSAFFVGPLYETLLQTGDIDVAVAAGRQELYRSLKSTSADANLEWGIPTLHRRIAGAKIFQSMRDKV
jgi:hypothetical protein